MPITLAEAKVGMADKVDQNVVDEFRRSSLLLDKLTFDNSISCIFTNNKIAINTIMLLIKILVSACFIV